QNHAWQGKFFEKISPRLLDERELDYHLANNTYSARLQTARRLGQKYGVTGLPTFIFSANQKIVGARSYETFREAARMLFERVRMEFVSASEGKKFARVVTDFTNQLKEMGPSPLRTQAV
ncbi:MAG: DsbA family protein, partial [Desulfotomaculales bacterium]